MLNIKTLSILAIAGSAVAAPQGWGSWAGKYFQGNRGGDDSNAVALEIVTAYTTVTYNGGRNGNWGGRKSSTSAAPVAAYTPAPSPAAPSPQPAPEDNKPAPAAPSKPAASSSAPVASSGGSTSGGYMGTVNTWRSKMGLSNLSQDSTLEGNALKTAKDGNGQMVHQLNPGSFAQVLAPGSADEFEKVFVGGWLCERPDMAGLNGICNTMSAGWAYGGQTGHADILTSTTYSKIGCAEATGIWSCDLS